MKRIFAALIICLVALSASAQEHLKVKGIPIDGNVNAFANKLRNAGLKHNALFSEKLGRTILEGDFAELHNCKWAFLSTNNGTVCKVIIMSESITGWIACKNKYNEMKELFSTKYELMGSYEYFRNPYYEGDGYELSALSQKKGDWQCFFKCEEGVINMVLDAADTREGYINISYEDNINMAKFTEEREKRISDDI